MRKLLPFVLILSACGGGGPSAPEPVLPQAMPTASVESRGVLMASAFDVGLRQKVRWSVVGNIVIATLTAPYDVEIQGRLVPLRLEVHDRGRSPQLLLAVSDDAVAPRGETVRWIATVPDAYCNRPIEAELWIAGAPRSGGYLVAILYSETGACALRPKPSPSASPTPQPTPTPTPTPSPTPSPRPTCPPPQGRPPCSTCHGAGK